MAKAIVDVVVDAMVRVRAGALGPELAARWKHAEAFLETMESESAPTFQAMYGPLLERPELSDTMRTFLTQAGWPTHQSDFFLQLIGYIGSALTTLPALGAIEDRQLVYALNKDYRDIPLSPADAADAVMRGIIPMAEGDADAAMGGVDPLAFTHMVDLIGEPPGPAEMRAVWQRGDMTDARFEEIVKYSRINDGYLPEFKAAAVSYMSPADVIELAIKGVIDTATAKDMFNKAGGFQDQFDQLYLGAGDAVGTDQVLTLWNHGLATEADVDATLGRSRINPVFYPLAKQLRHHFLAPFQIAELVKANPSLANDATQWLLADGYQADQVAALIAAQTKGAVAKTHTETEAMIVELYTEQVIDAATATTDLTNLGYDQGSAGMILELADAKRALSQRNAAVSAIRSAFVAGKVTHDAASMDLDSLNIPPAARDQWLAAWAVEASTKFHTLTAAQIGSLAKKGVIGYQTAIGRWVSMGYGQADAELLAAEYGGGPLLNADGTPVTVTP
jgi:hypothetical protein